MTDTAVLQRELDYFRKMRADRYRPAVFRSVLFIDKDVPPWAEKVVSVYSKSFAEIAWLTDNHTQFKQGTEERREEYSKIYRAGTAFEINDIELQRMEKLGWHIEDSRRTANATAAEQFLDVVAAVGDTDLGLKGLLTLSGPSSTVAGTKTGGGTTWTGAATFDELINDLILGVQAVRTQSLQFYECNQILLPEAQYNVAERKRNTSHPGFGPTVLDQFRKEYPGIRVKSWARGATAGAGSTPRAVFMNNAQEVARMIIPQEFQMHTPTRLDLGYRVAETFMTGGVITEEPKGITYMDGL